MTSATKQQLTFAPPGPGAWELDPVHFPRPVTAYWAQMHPTPFSLGFGDFMAFYGIPLRTRLTAYPSGFCYSQMQPVAPEEFPVRLARAAEVFEQKGWRDQAKEWEEVRKPAAVQAHREIQAIDPGQLADQALVTHLRRCRDHHAVMIRQHMAFTGTAVIPAGDFLVQTQGWTGLPTVKLLGLMRGASLISGGGSAQHTALVTAYRADPDARKALDTDDDPGELLESLRRADTTTGRALNDYLDFVGYRLLDGFDISGRYALEMPDVLLRSITTAIDGSGTEGDLEAEVAEVRGHVPEPHREEYDSLLAEARIGYAVRDERGVYSDIWASGLMRRAAMAAGRRLVERGRLHDAEHFVFADIDEMCAMLDGSPTPSADELAARLTYHRTYTAKDAPAHIGDDPTPPPDSSTLPPPMQRLMAAVGIAMSEMFGSSQEEHEGTVIRGLAASSGVAEGNVRRVAGPADFGRIQRGDILLTEATTEAFNILLPLLTAIITDSGGALSHAALVSREYGIPGVVGTRDATERIADGARVRVDGDKGEVTVLG
ncbi:MAG TPA: PEP-utilizing enzyme [Sporichthyaceae bacterium]|jgi:pyruvate,water dikinase|nr:PEP-utilizing enzyme [Sporichthyaceae bacterium]